MKINKELSQEQINKFTKAMISSGFKQEAVHEYRDLDGNIIYWRIRLKNIETGDKWIRPVMWDEKNSYQLQEPKFNKKPLYNLHKLAKFAHDEVVWLVEGEWCADFLINLGELALTSGSADSAIKADWKPLSGRKVVIWPDHDESGKRYADAVYKELYQLGCELWQVDTDGLKLPDKGDAIDWRQLHPEATIKDISESFLIDLSKKIESNNTEKDSEKRENQASLIVNFVMENSELFHDENSIVYAQDNLTKETRKLESRVFKDWVVSSFYNMTGISPREQSIKEALNTLSGIGRFEGRCENVYIRVAEHNNAYYIDLGVPKSSDVICVTPGKWEVLSDAPIKFIRSESMRPFPMPVGGGDFKLFWELVNIPKDVQLLVLCWLIECFRPDTPFPVIEILGEQGSAKSTTQSLLRSLIDPNACNLRAAPKSVEDIYVTGGVNWLVSYENISYLSPQAQDAFCILSTGGGYAKRKLYTDVDESVLAVKRPIILNGISASVTAQDLIDRTISIETPIITHRVEVNDVWNKFEENHAMILGALLDIFSKALDGLSEVELPVENCPRLIEFTRLGIATAKIIDLQPEVFLDAFNAARSESIARTIDASPIATALIELFEKSPYSTQKLPLKALLEQLEKYKPFNCESWPRTPKGLGDALRRCAPALRHIGINCKSIGKRGSYIEWEISKFN